MRTGLTMLLDAQPDIEVVAAAVDGRQAVSLARQLRPDVGLFDIRMPLMDGIEATRRLAGPDVVAPLPTVVITTFDPRRICLRGVESRCPRLPPEGCRTSTPDPGDPRRSRPNAEHDRRRGHRRRPGAAPHPGAAEGLCPPAPPPTEDGEACYCQACGSTGPVSRTRAARADAGRPVVLTPCQTCGTDRVHTEGQPRRTAGGVPLPRFRAVDRPAVVRTGDEPLPAWVGGPALTSELRVEADVTEVEFVGPSRAAALAAAGVHDVVALSRADRDLVVELPGVSDALAARIIASAAELVRRRGRRLPMGL